MIESSQVTSLRLGGRRTDTTKLAEQTIHGTYFLICSWPPLYQPYAVAHRRAHPPLLLHPQQLSISDERGGKAKQGTVYYISPRPPSSGKS